MEPHVIEVFSYEWYYTNREFEIILNLPSTILNTIKKISMEIHEIENFDIVDIEKFLVKNNFSVRRKYFLHENWPILYAKNQNFNT